ncbi:MAG: 2-isopropylmalate synthase [Deltaproteobacteria bacterium]|jgi:2-isopropylmalate synthase|nr:2-isopropylmalate synthase [Deltaproteobacteria bacterium]MBW2537863.1 2-isopropylmalate synthase [Deltaproteobacteria bacterium]
MSETWFDWNDPPAEQRTPSKITVRFGEHTAGVQVVDETLRDGLQNPLGINPPLEHKIDLLHSMARIGVDVVSVGLPAAGAVYAEDTTYLVEEILSAKLPLKPTAAARTVVSDVAAIARIADRTGASIEVYAFIGSSPIRHFVEGWTTEFLVGSIADSAREAARHNLPFTLVTEDTTRSHPDALRTMYRAGVDAGAARICICDTTGHVTPYGVERLVGFVRDELDALGAQDVGLDWHGHNDRGLALQNALWAASFGVERVHGTGLGVGERVGNASLELLVDNLARFGARPAVEREHLVEFCKLSARALSFPVPLDHPVAGAQVLAHDSASA